MNSRRKWIAAILLAGSALGAVQAVAASKGHAEGQPSSPLPSNPAAPASRQPAQQIAALDEALLQGMKAGHAAPFATRMAALTPVIQQVFDLSLIVRASVGPARWLSIPEAQKATLMEVFTQFTVASYVANFDSFSGETFTVAPGLRHVGQEVVVQTRIQGTSGDPTRLDYVMRETGGGWHVVDILLDGSISRVAVTRSDFRALLGPSGDATALIDSLRGKVASLTAGSAP